MVIRYSKPPTQRQLQTAESIRHALINVFLKNELSHPFFEKYYINISEVRISSDLKLATAFTIIPKELNEKELIKFLNDIAPMLRKLISKVINMRFAPTIRFVADEANKTADKVEELLSKIDKLQ